MKKIIATTAILLTGLASHPQAGNIVPAATNAASKVKFPDGFKSHFAEVNGLQIHYLIGGTGKPLLLLHGFPESWYTWRKVMPLLFNEFTLIVPDARGVGESSCPEKGYSKLEIAEDFYQLMDKLGYKKFYVAGHDWGGAEAFALTAAHPESVEKLIILEAGAMGSWVTNKDLIWFFGLMRQPNHFAEKVIGANKKQYFIWFWTNKEGNHFPNAIDDKAQEEYLRTYSTDKGMTAGFELYRTLDKDIEDNDRFSKNPLSIPVLAVGGEFSQKGKVAESMKHVANNVTEVIIPNSGHFVTEEQPDLTANIIRDFLKK